MTTQDLVAQSNELLALYAERVRQRQERIDEEGAGAFFAAVDAEMEGGEDDEDGW